MCVSCFMCVYILSVRDTVVGGLRGGEAYFNSLLKEINGLQMAQSIYSNETRSLAMSIEQRAGGGGGGGGVGGCGGGWAETPQVMTRPHSRDAVSDLNTITCHCDVESDLNEVKNKISINSKYK